MDDSSSTMSLEETSVVLEWILQETLVVPVLILTLLLLVVDYLRLVVAHCSIMCLVLRSYLHHVQILLH